MILSMAELHFSSIELSTIQRNTDQSGVVRNDGVYINDSDQH